MKKNLIFLLVGFAPFLSSCVAQPTTGSREIDLKTFDQLRLEKKDLMIIDVRTAAEYAESKIEGSPNIDVKQSSFESLINELDKNKPVIVYCRSGARSMRALEIMTKSGFTEVYSLQGGIELWQKEGRPVVKE